MKRYDAETLVKTYPRTRPELTPKHKELYEQEYKLNRQGRTLATMASTTLESWMHRKVARVKIEGPVLELGAGTLNHLPYETTDAAYDIVEPFVNLFNDSPNITRIRNQYDSIHDIPAENKYARIISIAVLEHITDLPQALYKSREHLLDGGKFQAGIPCEGGLLWGIAWRLSTGLAYRMRTGLSYKNIMRHEHVNNCAEIITLVKHYFRDVKIAFFPLPFCHGGFYAYIEASR